MTIAPIDDETLMAYLDGELSPARRAEVEDAVQADPALSALLERHRALGQNMALAFADVLDEPVPDALTRAARGPAAAPVVDLAAVRQAREARRAVWRRPEALGWLAASLLAVLIAGQTVLTPPSPLTTRHGRLEAHGALAQALSSELASAGPGRSQVRIILTFRNAAGQVCRSFASSALSGVACYDGKAWVVQGVFGGQDGAASGGYRLASGGDPRVMDLVGGLMVGEAFDATAERAARASGWRAIPPTRAP
ncbi:MAG: anti-sigma factor [Alphaproteobacteria bacterium]|nr:anti-sigma factor [Alphaproteobacteria bacterium]